MTIPMTNPSHPANKFVAPIIPGQFAAQHAARPHQCADCGLLNRHRNACPSDTETVMWTVDAVGFRAVVDASDRRQATTHGRAEYERRNGAGSAQGVRFYARRIDS